MKSWQELILEDYCTSHKKLSLLKELIKDEFFALLTDYNF